MRQFAYDYGMVTLSGELSTSSALVVEMRFVGHGVSQVMVDRKSFGSSWPCWCEVVGSPFI